MRAIARRRDVFIAELWGHPGNAASVRARPRDAAEIRQKRPRAGRGGRRRPARGAAGEPLGGSGRAPCMDAA
ncbi:UmuC protein [Streptomyces sp. NBRC 110611]|nr:UmuC protein [Streptomyces sp. NBRC 110611]